MQKTRLNTENVTTELLNDLAVNHAGLLGPYSRKEYDALRGVDITSWEFVFIPSKVDDSFGQLKIRPKTTSSTRLIDKGRAIALKDLDLNKEYPTGALINFIAATKRSSIGRTKKVQEFLLNNWEDYEATFKERATDEEFHQWMLKFKSLRFSKIMVEEIQRLMPATVKAMRKPSKQRAHTPRQQRNKHKMGKKAAAKQ